MYPFTSSGTCYPVDWWAVIGSTTIPWRWMDAASSSETSFNCLPIYIVLHSEDPNLYQHRCESFKYQITALSCKLHIRIYIREKKYLAEKNTVTDRYNMIMKGRFPASCLQKIGQNRYTVPEGLPGAFFFFKITDTQTNLSHTSPVLIRCFQINPLILRRLVWKLYCRFSRMANQMTGISVVLCYAHFRKISSH